MKSQSEHQAELRLEPTPDAPAQARDFVAASCADWSAPGFQEPGALAVSELVTNAVRHADTPIVVGLQLSEGALTISVLDGGAGDPHIVPPDQRLIGGRGLAMVAKLAEAWGVETLAAEKSVWCRLRVSGGGEAGTSTAG